MVEQAIPQKWSEDKALWSIYGPPGCGKSIIDFDDLDEEMQNLGVAPGTEIDSYELPKE